MGYSSLRGSIIGNGPVGGGDEKDRAADVRDASWDLGWLGTVTRRTTRLCLGCGSVCAKAGPARRAGPGGSVWGGGGLIGRGVLLHAKIGRAWSRVDMEGDVCDWGAYALFVVMIYPAPWMVMASVG